MKKIICSILIVCSVNKASTQIIAEDAKGQSSILYKNANVSFNVTEAQLSASINNFRKIHVADRPRQFLWQLEGSGKNADGLTALWNDGNLQASSRLGGFLGMRFRGYRQEYALYQQLDRLATHPDLIQYRAALDYKGDMNAIIAKDATLNFGQKKELRDALNTILKAQNFELASVITDATTLANTYHASGKTTLETALRNILTFLTNRFATAQSLKNNADNVRGEIDDVNLRIDEFRNIHPRKAYTFFLNVGSTASSYSLYANPNALPFSSRTKATNFRGGFLDIGFNYDAGAHWVFGLATGYEQANTFDTLSKKEYTERNTETNATQSFTTEKKYTAYSGFYTVYDRYSIKSDVLYFGKFNTEFRYVWNILYSRFLLPINDNRIQPIIVLGSSLNFYKQNGKFAGGFYLEEKDAANKLNKESSNFWNRLNFGISAKYSFLSIFDRQ